MRPSRLPVSALALLLALTLVACGDDDDDAGSVTAATRTPATEARDVTDATPSGAPATTAAATTSAPDTTMAAGPRVIEVRVVDGGPDGEARTERVDLDEEVVLRISSNVEEELHLHGYDLTAHVPAGGTADLAFTADIPGRFELESHHSERVVLQLEVR